MRYMIPDTLSEESLEAYKIEEDRRTDMVMERRKVWLA